MDIGSVTTSRPAALIDAVRASQQAASESAARDLPQSAVVVRADKPASVADDKQHYPADADLERRVIIDPDTQDIVFQSVDNATKSVVQQYPDKAILSRRAYIDKLEAQKSTLAEPTTQVHRIV